MKQYTSHLSLPTCLDPILPSLLVIIYHIAWSHVYLFAMLPRIKTTHNKVTLRAVIKYYPHQRWDWGWAGVGWKVQMSKICSKYALESIRQYDACSMFLNVCVILLTLIYAKEYIVIICMELKALCTCHVFLWRMYLSPPSTSFNSSKTGKEKNYSFHGVWSQIQVSMFSHWYGFALFSFTFSSNQLAISTDLVSLRYRLSWCFFSRTRLQSQQFVLPLIPPSLKINDCIQLDWFTIRYIADKSKV